MGKEIKFPKHMGLFNTSWQPKYIIHMHTHKSTIQLVMKFSNKDILTPTCCTISLNLFSLTPIWNSWSFIVGFKIYEQYNNCPFENIPVAGLMGLKRCCKLKIPSSMNHIIMLGVPHGKTCELPTSLRYLSFIVLLKLSVCCSGFKHQSNNLFIFHIILSCKI